MISTVAKQLDHFIRLNQAARSDIQWWYEFAESWNGTSMIIQAKKDNPDLVMSSDASGSWGCGAFIYASSGSCFNGQQDWRTHISGPRSSFP